jgi:hypothetical protein
MLNRHTLHNGYNASQSVDSTHMRVIIFYKRPLAFAYSLGLCIYCKNVFQNTACQKHMQPDESTCNVLKARAACDIATSQNSIVRVKTTLSVLELHSVYWNHTRACLNHTVRAKITLSVYKKRGVILICVKTTIFCVEITLVCVEITLVRVLIALCV